MGHLGEIMREWENDSHCNAECFKEFEFFGESEDGLWDSCGMEDFSRVIGECNNNGRAMFFKLGKKVLMAEMDAVERADCKGSVRESGDVIEGGVDDHV